MHAVNLHFSPTICCIVGYVGACCVTLGRPFALRAQDEPPQWASACPEPKRRVASLASTALSAASPFDCAQDRRRQSVRNAG
jgi:hypothetical protein